MPIDQGSRPRASPCLHGPIRGPEALFLWRLGERHDWGAPPIGAPTTATQAACRCTLSREMGKLVLVQAFPLCWCSLRRNTKFAAKFHEYSPGTLTATMTPTSGRQPRLEPFHRDAPPSIAQRISKTNVAVSACTARVTA